MNAHEKPGVSRRRFFGRIGTLLGAAAAAVLVRPQPPADPGTQAAGPVTKQGYRVTEHVRKYYDKARF